MWNIQIILLAGSWVVCHAPFSLAAWLTAWHSGLVYSAPSAESGLRSASFSARLCVLMALYCFSDLDQCPSHHLPHSKWDDIRRSLQYFIRKLFHTKTIFKSYSDMIFFLINILSHFPLNWVINYHYAEAKETQTCKKTIFSVVVWQKLWMDFLNSFKKSKTQHTKLVL